MPSPRDPAEPIPPRIGAPSIPGDLETAAHVRDDSIAVAYADLGDSPSFAHRTVEESTIDLATADTASFTGSTLIDVIVSIDRAVVIEAREASFRRVTLRGGRIGTLDLSRSMCQELVVEDCRIDYITFGGGRVTDVEFRRCEIRALDVPQTEISRVAFVDSAAREVDTNAMRALHLDLRGLDVGSFLDVSSLRGAVLSHHQVEQIATTLAGAAGIIVR